MPHLAVLIDVSNAEKHFYRYITKYNTVIERINWYWVEYRQMDIKCQTTTKKKGSIKIFSEQFEEKLLHRLNTSKCWQAIIWRQQDKGKRKYSKEFNLEAIHKYAYASRNMKTIPVVQTCSHFDNTHTWACGNGMKSMKFKFVVNSGQVQ